MAKRYDNLFQEVVSFENLYLPSGTRALPGMRRDLR